MRTVAIGVFSFVGGMCLAQGAARGMWRLTTLGILLLSIALGIILIKRRNPTRLIHFIRFMRMVRLVRWMLP